MMNRKFTVPPNMLLLLLCLQLLSTIILDGNNNNNNNNNIHTRYSVAAWIPPIELQLRHLPQQQQRRSLLPSSLRMAGFGDTTASKNNELKLKPKQQWDRYIALKKEPSVMVGVKVIMIPSDTTTSNTTTTDWLEVGAVKCESSISIAVAVARQRALLVEHAKRLYPLQISPKAQIEWGYRVPEQQNDEDTDTITSNSSDDHWVTVDKTVLLDSAATSNKGIEKRMGFVGTPDPTTGFYCVYNEGRLVTGTDGGSSAARPSSKKLG